MYAVIVQIYTSAWLYNVWKLKIYNVNRLQKMILKYWQEKHYCRILENELKGATYKNHPVFPSHKQYVAFQI